MRERGGRASKIWIESKESWTPTTIAAFWLEFDDDGRKLRSGNNFILK